MVFIQIDVVYKCIIWKITFIIQAHIGHCTKNYNLGFSFQSSIFFDEIKGEMK